MVKSSRISQLHTLGHFWYKFPVRPEFLFFLLGYLVLVLLIGLKFSRRMRSLEDFFLASRSLSAALVFLSLTASWFGASSILVTADEAFRAGVSSFWLIGLPAVATVLIFAFILAGPIRRLDIVTLPDLVERRYGKAVRHLASGLIFWYMAVLASSQMVALGQFIRPFLKLPYFWSLALGTGVVLIYLLSGGLRSVAATDVLQCILLAGGVIGLAIFLIRSSPAAALSEVVSEAGKPGYFQFFFDPGRNTLIALSFIFAWTISPIAWQRIQSARSEAAARLGLVAAAGAFVVLYGLVVVIGMFALPLFSSRPLSGPLISEIIASRVGRLGGGLLFVAVLAAILSTLDTALNTGALTLTKDIYLNLRRSRSRMSPASVQVGRVATLLSAGLAFVIATRFQSILQTLGLASEIMAEGLFVPGVAMVFLRGKKPLAGGLSLALGGGFALASFLSAVKVLPLRLPAWPFSVPYGLALSLLGFAAGLLFDRFPLRFRFRSRP
jgi:SSS family solute:Na+ symporter